MIFIDPLICPLDHVERFRNLKLAAIRITNIQSTVVSSSEGTAAIHLAAVDSWRGTFGDSQESPGLLIMKAFPHFLLKEY